MSWPSRRGYDDHVPNRRPAFNRAITFRTSPHTNDTAQGSWLVFEERVLTGPLATTRYPMQPNLPLQILLLNSPPMFPTQWNMNIPTQSEPDDSKLTREEQNKALSKLKKETYNPTLKSLSKRLCLYYRDKARNINHHNEAMKAKDEKDDDDGKTCAICLEDFEAREEVTVTPCSHMFHESCIVPWVKSHGQCPVCRFIV